MTTNQEKAASKPFFKTARQAQTSSEGSYAVASAILLDALRRVRANGPNGMWGAELSWHLRLWGSDAYDILQQGIHQCLQVENCGALGLLLRSTTGTSTRIAELAQVEGVEALIKSITGDLPDRHERGGRLVDAFSSSLQTFHQHLSSGHQGRRRDADLSDDVPYLKPIVDLLSPLFGGMLLGYSFSPDGRNGVGLSFYCSGDDFPCGPFASLRIALDAGQIRFSDDAEGTTVLLGDDRVTLGDLERICRIGGWASHHWKHEVSDEL